MALEMKYKAITGSDYSKAYYRVIQVDCNWATKGARATVYIHRNLSSRTVGEEPVGHLLFDFAGDVPGPEELPSEINGTPSFEEIFGIAVFDVRKTNPLKLVYEYLKTLPEFEDAKDV